MPGSIGIIGAGAVGGLIAATLANSGRESVYAVARGRTASALRTDGVEVRTPAGSFRGRPQVCETPYQLPPECDIIFVAVPCHQLEPVRKYFEVSADRAVIIPLCNGVNARELIDPEGRRGKRLYYGAVAVECWAFAPGCVFQMSPTCKITFSGGDRESNVAARLRAAGLNVTASTTGPAVVWKKAAFLIPITLACAAVRGDIKHVRANAGLWGAVEDACGEIANLANASGAPISAPGCRFIANRLRRGMIPSAARDVIDGRASEIDSLVAPLLEAAKRFNIPAPRLNALYKLHRAALAEPPPPAADAPREEPLFGRSERPDVPAY
jgi:2-dehydropantoate 2-reductase